MTVNPAYLHVTDNAIPSSFPKSDTYCAPQNPVLGTQPPPLCTLDYRPYANDLHDAARSAARGDTLERSAWSPDPPTPHYAKGQLQPSGLQSVMAFTDAATAARYSLPVARLQNSSGQFVAPDAAGLKAGLAAMTQSSVAGVLQPNPAATDPAAYPLTSITYGATVPSALSAQERSDYADFIQYAVTSGQQTGGDVGQLPVGYLPLSQSLVTQALTTSVGLRSYVAPTPVVSSATPSATKKPSTKPTTKPTSASPTARATTPTPSTTTVPPPTPTFDINPPENPSPTIAPPGATTVSATGKPSGPPATTTSPAATAPTASVAPPVQNIAEVRRTPDVPGGPGRYTVIVILAIGGLCALSGPGLMRWSARRAK
jgi:hypothetical protein